MTTARNRFHFLAAYMVSLLTAYTAAYFLTPPQDVSQKIADAAAKYPIPAFILQPEPHEFLRFVLFWILFIVLFSVLYALLILPKSPLRYGYSGGASLVLAASILLLFFYCLFKNEWDYTKTLKGQWYIQNTIMELNPLLLFSIVLCFTAGLVLFRKYALQRFSWLADLRWRWLICGSLSIILILYSGLFVYKPDPFYSGNGLFHDSFYLTTVYSIYNGGTIGVDADAVYGGHGYFLAPLLKIIGYSHHRCVFLLVLICIWAFSCLFYLAKVVGKTPEKTLFTFAFVIQVMVFFAFGAHTGHFFYQHVPHRVVFPVTVLVYILNEKKFRHRKVYIIGGYLLSSLALIWNIESGLAALGIFFVTEILRVFSLHFPKERRFWRSAFSHLVGAAASVGGFFAAMWLIAFLRTGQSVSLRSFYITQFTFARLGYGMLPLPEGASMYMPVFALVAFGVACTLFWIFQNTGKGFLPEDIKLTAALSAASAISLVYFMGRTDTRTLIPVLWPAQLLLCLFLSRLSTQAVLSQLSQLEKSAVKLAVYPLSLVVCLYAVSIPYTIVSTPSIPPYIYAQRTHTIDTEYQEELDFLRKWKSPDGTVNLISYYGPILAAELGLRTTYVGECTNDIYDYQGYDVLIEYISGIAASGEPLLLDGYAVSSLSSYSGGRYEQLMEQYRYVPYESAQSIQVFLPEGTVGD